MTDAASKPIRERLHWDSGDFIDSIEELIQTRIDLDQAVRCSTLGEFENLVLSQIRSEQSETDHDFTHRVLREMNASAAKKLTKPLSERDLGVSIEAIARAARPGPWRDVYFIIADRVMIPVPKVRPILFSKFVLVLMLVLSVAAVFTLWTRSGWFLAVCAAPVLLIGTLSGLIWLPARVVGSSPTLGEAIEHYRLFVGEARQLYNDDDIRSQIRVWYASWSSKPEEYGPVDETEDISWIWIDMSNKPISSG